MSSFHSLRVSNIDKLTSKAVIVSFEIPPTLMGDFNFMAGTIHKLTNPNCW